MFKSYDRKSYSSLKDQANLSAREVAQFLIDQFKFEGIVDIGCGDGSWLQGVRSGGGSALQCTGVDGSWARSINEDRPFVFVAVDLSKKFDVGAGLTCFFVWKLVGICRRAQRSILLRA